MNRAEACAVLGCKDRELASIEDVDGQVVLITTDGRAYTVVGGKPVACPTPEVDEAGELIVEKRDLLAPLGDDVLSAVQEAKAGVKVIERPPRQRRGGAA